MRQNSLRETWTSGGAAVNGWLAIPNGFSAETMAHQGWDSLTIDLQHGVVAGIHNGSPEAALKRIAKGFQFVTIASDARLMAAGAQAVLAKMRAS